MSTPTLMTKSVSTTPMKIHLELPTDAGVIKGYITAHAKVKSKANHRDFAKRVADNEYNGDDMAMLKDMYASIDGLGKDGESVVGDDVWDFLENDPLGSFIVPALVTGWFEQFNKARVGNSAASSKR